MFHPPTVVVLGSKPHSPLPDVQPVAVYTANGAASKAHFYRQYEDVRFVCVVSSRQMMKTDIQQRVIQLQPERIVARFHKSDVAGTVGEHLPQTHIEYLHIGQQYQMQRRYFDWRLFWSHFTIKHSKTAQNVPGRGLTFWRLWLREMANLWHSTPGESRRYLGGISTGLFAMVCALEEWPQARIVLSGISLVTGEHHYGSEKFSTKVAIRDKRVMPHIRPDARSRLFTTDDTMHQVGHVALWPGATVPYTYEA